MFKGGTAKESPVNSPDKLNRIVEGAHIKGDVRADSNFRIDGVLEGTIDTSGKLVIGPLGRIEGEVKCGNADIEGFMEGNLVVEGLLMIKSTAKIYGNIVAGQIGIEVGADFKGQCNIEKVSGRVKTNESAAIAKGKSELVY